MIISRDLLKDILPWIGKEKIIILKGARQVGKTTLMHLIMDEVKKKQGKTLYFAADLELANPLFNQAKLLIRFLEDQCPKRKKLYVFIDEFQSIQEAGLFMKVIFDQLKKKVQFILSGSSSLEIGKNTEFLTGRKVEFFVPAISFREFLSYKSPLNMSLLEKPLEELKIDHEIYAFEIQELLLKYISHGGYPDVLLEKNLEHKTILLKELIQTYLQKDIAAFLRIENLKQYNQLITLLCGQIGGLIKRSEISNTLDLSENTVRKYLHILEETYVFDFLRPFTSNLRKELVQMPKVFVHDLGIHHVMIPKIFATCYQALCDGQVMENFAYLALKNLYGKDKLHFYRTLSKSEIDFILTIDSFLIPIEVKFTKKPPQRPSRAMYNFEKIYEKRVLFFVYVTKAHLEYFPDTKTLCIPIYLLEFFCLKAFIRNTF